MEVSCVTVASPSLKTRGSGSLVSVRGDPAMAAVSFDTWLGAIRLLTACQRQEGFMSLALAEADDEAASVRIDAPPMFVGGGGCGPGGAGPVPPNPWGDAGPPGPT